MTAFAFLVLGGIEALLMRLQLSGPNRQAADARAIRRALHHARRDDDLSLRRSDAVRFQQLSLAAAARRARHGVPAAQRVLLLGLSLLPGCFIYASFLFGAAPNDGWFNYVPYASRAFNPGPNIDFYSLGLIFLGISTTVGAVNFVVTFLRMRAPGHVDQPRADPDLGHAHRFGRRTSSPSRASASPSSCCGSTAISARHFFDVSAGGQPLLWQHLFWMFGHPWVYAIVLPAMGMVSDGLPTFCRRPLVGYSLVALSTVATMVLGFGVWLHHMFATGLSDSGAVVLQRRVDLHRGAERGRACSPGSRPSGPGGRSSPRPSCSSPASSCCSSSAASRAS